MKSDLITKGKVIGMKGYNNTELSNSKAVGILFDAIRDVYVTNNSRINFNEYSMHITIEELRMVDPDEAYFIVIKDTIITHVPLSPYCTPKSY